MACAAGFADCDANPANGCEASTLTSAEHCGGCGMACASGVCAAGRCGSLTTCRTIHETLPSAPSGVFTIDPDGTLRGTATFTFTNVTAATYDVLIGSRHSSNRNDMRALFTVNGEAVRIDQRTGDGALAIVTDLWGRRALSGTVLVVLDHVLSGGIVWPG